MWSVSQTFHSHPMAVEANGIIPSSAINQTHAEADWHASGRAGILPAVPGILPGTPDAGRPPFRRHAQPMAEVPGRIPGTAGETPALPKTRRPALRPVVSGRWYHVPHALIRSRQGVRTRAMTRIHFSLICIVD